MIFAIIFIDVLLLSFLLFGNKNGEYLKNKKRFLISLVYLVVSLLASFFLVSLLEIFLLAVLSSKYSYTETGIVWDNMFFEVLYNFIYYFLAVALVEELGKILPTYHFLEGDTSEIKTKFDCMIPFLLVSMGFSIVEDILYIYKYYPDEEFVGFMRLIVELPGHVLWGLLIGEAYYRYTVKCNVELLRYRLKQDDERFKYVNTGMYSQKIFKVATLLIIILHGLFDFLLVTNSTIGYIYIFISFVYFSFYLLKLKNVDLKEATKIEFMNYQNVCSEEEFEEKMSEINNTY